MIRRRLCLLFLLTGMTLFAYSQGLLFQANDKEIKERTSLQIFQEGEIPCFTKNFQLSFELSIRDFDTFGYVFLLKEDQGKTKYSFTYTYLDGENSTFKFNTDGKENHYSLNLRNDALAYQWIPVSFAFDSQQDVLPIRIGDNEKKITSLGLKDTFCPHLFFGRYDYILDMPTFAIRNLKLEGDRSHSYTFPLNENEGEEVHTSTGKVLGTVVNPVWLINGSYHWEKLFEYSFQTPSGITFEPDSQRLIIFSQDSLLTYNLLKRQPQKYSYSNKLPVKLQLATHFMNTTDGKLYVYELNNLPLGDATVAALDLNNREWKQTGVAALPVQLHHHDGFWDETTGKYLVFGGFGNKRFNNTFLEYDIEADRWDTLSYSGDWIIPRYFSGMAVNKNREHVYVFGGMGNESGEQSVGRNYLHDLYLLDRKQQSVRRLWQNASDHRLVVARDMILTPDEKYIYALCYPEYLSDTYLRLYRLTVDDGTMKALGDSIPMRSEEIMTNANLYYNSLTHEYYCTTTEFDKKGHTVIRTYVLSAPPVSLDEIRSYGSRSSLEIRWLWIMAGIGVLLLAGGVLFVRKKRGKQRNAVLESSSVLMSPPVGREPDKSVQGKETLAKEDFESSLVRPNAVYLFGPFTVIDRNGRDITHLFSSRLRQVFIYILLHSTHNGVLSASLNEVFWPDKPDDKVKNLKGVTINQIRKNLAELDGVELVHDKGYFRLVFTDCYCDYFRFRTLKNAEEVENELGILLMRGKFLDGMDAGMMDHFKQKVEEFLSSFLPLEIERLYQQHKYDAVIRFCNVLFRVDPVNELALAYGMHALNHTGSSQEAILQYSLFVREYRQMMNEEYSTSYAELMSKNPPFHR
ncbi:Kelch repeat-containing protein [Bacteroides thetaiotaomicron]|uniref:Kelch repeat-containing protein n=1 Tax=Bacteroides thetaiotaomicron TaxID=818 RepID=UPI00189CFCA4|nr:kelch repeat-containing protein [Bacteroides thetaiotaomicron]